MAEKIPRKFRSKFSKGKRQIVDETMYASSGNKHFFTKYIMSPSDLPKQSRQKLGTFLENKVLKKLKKIKILF